MSWWEIVVGFLDNKAKREKVTRGSKMGSPHRKRLADISNLQQPAKLSKQDAKSQQSQQIFPLVTTEYIDKLHKVYFYMVYLISLFLYAWIPGCLYFYLVHWDILKSVFPGKYDPDENSRGEKVSFVICLIFVFIFHFFCILHFVIWWTKIVILPSLVHNVQKRSWPYGSSFIAFALFTYLAF